MVARKVRHPQLSYWTVYPGIFWFQHKKGYVYLKLLASFKEWVRLENTMRKSYEAFLYQPSSKMLGIWAIMHNQLTKTNQTACSFTISCSAHIDNDYMIRHCIEQFREQGNASIKSMNHLRPPSNHLYWQFKLMLPMTITKFLSL